MKVDSEQRIVLSPTGRTTDDDIANADLLAAFGVLLAQASASPAPSAADDVTPSAAADAAPEAATAAPQSEPTAGDPAPAGGSTAATPQQATSTLIPGALAEPGPVPADVALDPPTTIPLPGAPAKPAVEVIASVTPAPVGGDTTVAMTPVAASGEPTSITTSPASVTAPPSTRPLDPTGTGATPVPPVPGGETRSAFTENTSDALPHVLPGIANAPAPPTTPIASASPSPSTTPTMPPTPTPATQLVAVLAPLRSRPDGTTKLTLALRPEDLGRVDVDLRIERGTVHVVLRAEQPTTVDLLRDSINDLRGQLHDRGIATGDFSVGAHARQQQQEPNAEDPRQSVDEAVIDPPLDAPPTDSDALVDVRM